jgi:hypothetical protein
LAGLLLTAFPASDEQRRSCVERLLDYWILLYGRAAFPLFQKLAEEGGAYLEFVSDRLKTLSSRIDFFSVLRQPNTIRSGFEWAAFDPTRNRLPLDNAELLRLLIDSHSYSAYSVRDIVHFQQSMQFWIDRAPK